jgi:AraC-like DNA-binding protein
LQGQIPEPNRLPLRVLHVARATLWPWWHLHCKPAGWLLYGNNRDGASIICKKRRWPLRGLRTLVIPPGVPYDTSPGPDTVQIYAQFDVPGLPSGMPSEPLDLGDDPLLASILSELHQTLIMDGPQRDPVLLNLAHTWIRLAFARLLSHLPATARAAWATRGKDQLDAAVEHIEHTLGQPQYIAELAGRCGMGPQWFSKRFRSRFGKSPAQYLIERRIAVAAQRLVHEDVGIEPLAEACGFTDRAHFSRAFTRRMGQSPGRYRAVERARFLAS